MATFNILFEFPQIPFKNFYLKKTISNFKKSSLGSMRPCMEFPKLNICMELLKLYG